MGKNRANSFNVNPHLFHHVLTQNRKLIFLLVIEEASPIISKSDRLFREKLNSSYQTLSSISEAQEEHRLNTWKWGFPIWNWLVSDDVYVIVKENRCREKAAELNTKQLVNEHLSTLWSDSQAFLILFSRKSDCVYY